MKTQEELIALANEIKDLNSKLKALSEEELQMVTGGFYRLHLVKEEIDQDNP